MEHRREFIENCPYGKQIGKTLDLQNMQKRPQAPKPIFLGLGSEKSENHLKFAHNISVHNGSYAFPNELVRFRNEAKPIWVETQKAM